MCLIRKEKNKSYIPEKKVFVENQYQKYIDKLSKKLFKRKGK